MVKRNEKKRQKPKLKRTGKRPGIWGTGAGERVLESNQSITGQMHDEIKGNGDLHFFLYIKSPGVSWEDITPGRMDKDLGQSISRKIRCDGLEGARANMRHHSALLKAGLGRARARFAGPERICLTRAIKFCGESAREWYSASGGAESPGRRSTNTGAGQCSWKILTSLRWSALGMVWPSRSRSKLPVLHWAAACSSPRAETTQ